MSRAKKTHDDVRKQFADPRRRTGKGHPAPGRDAGSRVFVEDPLQQMELMSLVLKQFCKGKLPGEIQGILKNKHGIEISREVPYNMVSMAAANGWLRYTPPLETPLRERLKDRYPSLQSLDVVQTAVFDDVAWYGTQALANLLRSQRQIHSREEVHVGLAGGLAMRKLAQAFATYLRSSPEGLPRTIVFHAMAAGFDTYDPSTAPNSFFTYFVTDPDVPPHVRFVALNAPAVVESESFAKTKTLQGIREAFKEAAKLDIIVTSASLWSDEHSMLLKYMQLSKDSLEELKRAGCVGDMLWRPIGNAGPIEIETKYRAMTLVELSELSSFIQRGKNVLLVIGPCGACNRHKAEIVETILGQKAPLVTNLVVDVRTARGLVDRLK